MKHTLCTICLLTGCLPLFSQLSKGITYSTESNIVWSNGDDYAPFWFTSNRYGMSSADTNNGYLRAGIFRSTKQDNNRKWKQGYALELAAAYNYSSSFIVQQAYYDLAYGPMQLSIGSKERKSALKNPLLSGGGLTFGTNARPIPEVRFELPEYLTIPGTNDWIHIKGFLSYGRYTDNNWQKDFAAPKQRYTKNALHHGKAGFMKIGNEKKFPLYFEGGLEMAAQFGGTAYNVTHGRGESTTETIHMSSGIKDFFKAFIPSGSDPTDGSGYDNVAGNHLGSWHFSLCYAQAGEWKIRAYYEHFFEDHSMMFFEYGWKDGLAGLEITLPKNPFVHTVVYEYMGSKDQAGPVYHDHTPEIPDQISAIDNYYNHTIYTGWQHWGMAIGSPFILSPIYNTDGSIRFMNNRAIVHHIGIYGEPTSQLSYRILASHAKYWGTYMQPLLDTKEQTSTLLEIAYSPKKWQGWQVNASAAYDHGKMLGNNFGGMVTLRKTGVLTR